MLADPELREGIKAYTNWPTIPQLYVKGEFVGGADIVREMFQAGELQQQLSEAGIAVKQPDRLIARRRRVTRRGWPSPRPIAAHHPD